MQNQKLLDHTNFEEGAECSETWAHKIQTPGNQPKGKNTTNQKMFSKYAHMNILPRLIILDKPITSILLL